MIKDLAKIFRKAAEIVLDQNPGWQSGCCRAIEMATEDVHLCYAAKWQFSKLYSKSAHNLDHDLAFYFNEYCEGHNKRNQEHRVLALLLAAELAKRGLYLSVDNVEPDYNAKR